MLIPSRKVMDKLTVKVTFNGTLNTCEAVYMMLPTFSVCINFETHVQ